MCLILLAFKAHPDADVVLAGNRDEYIARPSAPPAVIGQNPVIHAGLDLEAGGTWMGRNEHGLLAALTNTRDPAFSDPPDVLSRGGIVRGLLEHRDPEGAAAWLATQDPDRYRPFNVLFGNGEAFFSYASRGGSTPILLQPGFHALSNSTLNDRSWPKVMRSHNFFTRYRQQPGEAFLMALQAFLCDPTPPDTLPAEDREEEIHGPLGAVFIGTPGYGTVSASIITSGGSLGERYYFAEAGAMHTAQSVWAQPLVGNGGEPPSSPDGSPFKMMEFPD